MVYGPPGFSVFRPWSNVGPRQMWMPRPTRPMVSYNYTNQCCGSYGSGMGNGAWWALGIGGFIGLLPNILGWCGVGGGRKAAAAEETAAQTAADRSSTLANLEKLYKDKGYTVIDEGGKFYVTKDGETIAEGKTFAEIQTAMNEIIKPEAPKADASGFTQQEALTAIKEFGVEGKITFTDDGKIQYKDANDNVVTQEFTQTNLYKAISVVMGTSNQPPAADDPVATFNNNPAVKAKNATIAKNGDKYTLTINNANGSKTIYECASIEDAYTKLGLSTDGTPIKRKSTYIKAQLPEGYSWQVSTGKYDTGTSVDVILADLHKDQKLKGITKQDLLNANPVAIQNGKVSGKGKLEIPMPEINLSELLNHRGQVRNYGTIRESIIRTSDNGDGTETVTETFVKLDTAFQYRRPIIPTIQHGSTSDS